MSNNSESLTLEEIVREGVKLTPMMEQYYDIKKQYKDVILMFRMGDFYEVFFEDAIETSKLLNISLTHRGKLGDHKIPMAGIPHHAAISYVDRLTEQGKKVAICEQIEDPKAAKGIVKRAVTQVVSPGIPYDLDRSESHNNHFIGCAFKQHDSQYYLVLMDFTTGEFLGMDLPSVQDVVEKVQLYRPKEMLAYLGQWEEMPLMQALLDQDSLLVTHLSEEYFNEKYTNLYIEKLIPAYQKDEVIKSHTGLIAPIGALSYYVCSTQAFDKISHFRPFQMVNHQQEMKITYPTLVGLEILPKNKDDYKNSLLGFMDRTKTAMGARKLKKIFQAPLRDKAEIENRLNVVEQFSQDYDGLNKIRSILFDIRDIERILAKASTGKINSADMINLAAANDSYIELEKSLPSKKFLAKMTQKKELKELATLIQTTINDEVGCSLDKGNLIKEGCHKERDRLSKLSLNAKDALIALEAKYREETGIGNLKIKSNNVAGYFIEVSKSHLAKVPKHFERRQTLVNSERFQSPELADFEKEVITAREKLYKLEKKIFDNVVSEINGLSSALITLSLNISLIDIFQSFAWVSLQENFVRPQIKDQQIVHIRQAWHPLIKSNLQDRFVHHNLRLDETVYFGLITGPNMAGKTTVMREIAIIQFLCQLGCFVPAEMAVLGLTDYIFSRLGAHDDIIKGQSTFMVEMSETAEIIRHATKDSLIILDEIGRGTSTYDGLSIAWALVEYFIMKTKAITLFSTHYHELIDLVNSLPQAKNLTVKTVNSNGNVQFLYELIEEGAAQSFGIHVAKLAGLPPEILGRSKQILTQLESTEHTLNLPVVKNNTNQLNLFDEEVQIEEKEHPILKELKSMDVMNLTPMQALQKLDELKANYLN
ncbi:MAG: DNA mismatch repair protein MutS [Bdellovibrionota bacterium]|nr:DNA mismatch repair protein MutS [Bdellovibrionota bacterium]